MEHGSIALSVGGYLVMRVPPEAGWEGLREVVAGLPEGRDREVILDTGPLKLGARQLVEVERLLNGRGYRLARVVHGLPSGPAHGGEEAPAGPQAGSPAPTAREKGRPREPGARPRREVGERTLVRRGPLRSGQLIRYRGNVVILGDVNPGAQVVATGDVIVLGTLRGVAHAGADGSRGAVVAALRLCPTQLRIADLVRRCPEDDPRQGSRPELARVRETEIVVEAL